VDTVNSLRDQNAKALQEALKLKVEAKLDKSRQIFLHFVFLAFHNLVFFADKAITRCLTQTRLTIAVSMNFFKIWVDVLDIEFVKEFCDVVCDKLACCILQAYKTVKYETHPFSPRFSTTTTSRRITIQTLSVENRSLQKLYHLFGLDTMNILFWLYTESLDVERQLSQRTLWQTCSPSLTMPMQQ
jgi:hypothetical protein